MVTANDPPRHQISGSSTRDRQGLNSLPNFNPGVIDSMDQHLQSFQILKHGHISLEGQFLWGSNYTMLVDIHSEGTNLKAVYKPTKGERPLWDFPRSTLALREVAAYLISEEVGWNLVPPTVYREEGPLGPGSLQLFVEHDPEYHYFNFKTHDRQRLRPIALFDFLINNADRKGGHILLDQSDHIWVIDHGICFHEQDKLRTVLWDFAGERLPENLCRDVARFRPKLNRGTTFFEELEKYLSKFEIEAIARRADRLLTSEIFPHPPKNSRPYPWPLI